MPSQFSASLIVPLQFFLAVAQRLTAFGAVVTAARHTVACVVGRNFFMTNFAVQHKRSISTFCFFYVEKKLLFREGSRLQENRNRAIL